MDFPKKGRLGNIGLVQKVNNHAADCIGWVIRNFSSYTTAWSENDPYHSPRFEVAGSVWYLSLLMKCNRVSAQCREVFVLLSRESVSAVSASKQGVQYGISFLTQEGIKHMRKVSWIFDNEHNKVNLLLAMNAHPSVSGGPSMNLRINDLLQHLPNDSLTIYCKMSVSKCLDYFSTPETLSLNLLDMFTSKKCYDTTLKVQDQEFHVHKCILAARSHVFSAMFESNMRERNTGVVEINDFNPDAFGEFLHFLYSGKTKNLSQNPFEIFKIAHKYDVRDLEAACLIYIAGNLSVENICEIVLFQEQFPDHSLKIGTQVFFNNNFKKIVSSDKWMEFLKANPILANDLIKSLSVMPN